MEKIYRILVINPGSTSTKIAVFDNEKEVFSRTLRHSTEELQPYKQVADQFGFRKQLIIDALLEANIDIQSLSAVIGRGGLVKPIPSGVYEVNETLKHDLIHAPQGEHASNLGGLLAADIAAMVPGAKAYIADPVVVDELQDIARIAGHELFKRVSIFHECVEQNRLKRLALNRHIRPLIGLRYQCEINLSVYHLLIQLLRIGSSNGHADMRIGLLKLSKRLNKELRRAGHRVVSDMQLRHHSLLGFLQLRSHSVIRIQNFVNPF